MMDFQINEKQLLRDIAWFSLREWLASDNFKPEEVCYKVFEETSVGKEIEKRKQKHSFWWKGEDGQRLHKLKDGILATWRNEGWIVGFAKRKGRRRKKDHSLDTIRKAVRIYGNGCQGYISTSTFKWAASILGENGHSFYSRYKINDDKTNQQLLDEVDDEVLDGKTKDEVAELLQLPRTYSNRFIRWLVAQRGWKIKQSRANGRKRTLVKPECSLMAGQ